MGTCENFLHETLWIIFTGLIILIKCRLLNENFTKNAVLSSKQIVSCLMMMIGWTRLFDGCDLEIDVFAFCFVIFKLFVWVAFSSDLWYNQVSCHLMSQKWSMFHPESMSFHRVLPSCPSIESIQAWLCKQNPNDISTNHFRFIQFWKIKIYFYSPAKLNKPKPMPRNTRLEKVLTKLLLLFRLEAKKKETTNAVGNRGKSFLSALIDWNGPQPIPKTETLPKLDFAFRNELELIE